MQSRLRYVLHISNRYSLYFFISKTAQRKILSQATESPTPLGDVDILMFMRASKMYMSCIVQRRKKAGRRQSPQVNIGNLENTMEMNSGYESLSSNQANETIAYATIASTETSHPATHDRTGNINDDYLQPVVPMDLPTRNTRGTVPGVYHNAIPADTASSSGNTYQSLQPSQAAAIVYDRLQYDG